MAVQVGKTKKSLTPALSYFSGVQGDHCVDQSGDLSEPLSRKLVIESLRI
jgi:hypothetical protein